MKRKPRRLVEEPHRFLAEKLGPGKHDTARARPDGFQGRKGWRLIDCRATKSLSYWVAKCVMVGCMNETIPFVCGACNGWGEDAKVSVDWWLWYQRKPSVARMKRLLAAHFEEHQYEVAEPVIEGYR